MYSLDTSFFMDWQARYYPLDLFPTLERNIVGMIAAGTCGAVELVREEIDAVGTPGSGLGHQIIPVSSYQ